MGSQAMGWREKQRQERMDRRFRWRKGHVVEINVPMHHVLEDYHGQTAIIEERMESDYDSPDHYIVRTASLDDDGFVELQVLVSELW